jgi:uncharacterized protein
MLRDTILLQKKEYEDLLTQNYVLRGQTEYAQKFLDKNIIKVVLGPRRAGKSIFCANLIRNKKPVYLNFDDENLIGINDFDYLIKEMLTVYNKPKYLFFDEIQNINNWELLVNKLQRQDYNIILTGSNANLLSQELSTHLTGRHIPIEILPFNFKEFLEAKKLINDHKEQRKHLDDFLKIGGFPEVVMKKLTPQDYLSTLIDSVLFKDIVKRHKLRLPEKLYNLAIYFLNNYSSEFSYRKLAKKLDFKSDITAEKFVKHLNASYLSQIVARYSFKPANRIISPKKSYLIDNGYIQAKSLQFSKNQGKIIENLVFTELLKRNYHPNKNLFYFKTKNDKEIDFILRSDLKTESLIQVTYNLNDDETKEREMKALIEASLELKCNDLNIISLDPTKTEIYKGKKIKIINLLDWLLK